MVRQLPTLLHRTPNNHPTTPPLPSPPIGGYDTPPEPTIASTRARRSEAVYMRSYVPHPLDLEAAIRADSDVDGDVVMTIGGSPVGKSKTGKKGKRKSDDVVGLEGQVGQEENEAMGENIGFGGAGDDTEKKGKSHEMEEYEQEGKNKMRKRRVVEDDETDEEILENIGMVHDALKRELTATGSTITMWGTGSSGKNVLGYEDVTMIDLANVPDDSDEEVEETIGPKDRTKTLSPPVAPPCAPFPSPRNRNQSVSSAAATSPISTKGKGKAKEKTTVIPKKKGALSDLPEFSSSSGDENFAYLSRIKTQKRPIELATTSESLFRSVHVKKQRTNDNKAVTNCVKSPAISPTKSAPTIHSIQAAAQKAERRAPTALQIKGSRDTSDEASPPPLSSPLVPRLRIQLAGDLETWAVPIDRVRTPQQLEQAIRETYPDQPGEYIRLRDSRGDRIKLSFWGDGYCRDGFKLIVEFQDSGSSDRGDVGNRGGGGEKGSWNGVDVGIQTEKVEVYDVGLSKEKDEEWEKRMNKQVERVKEGKAAASKGSTSLVDSTAAVLSLPEPVPSWVAVSTDSSSTPVYKKRQTAIRSAGPPVPLPPRLTAQFSTDSDSASDTATVITKTSTTTSTSKTPTPSEQALFTTPKKKRPNPTVAKTPKSATRSPRKNSVQDGTNQATPKAVNSLENYWGPATKLSPTKALQPVQLPPPQPLFLNAREQQTREASLSLELEFDAKLKTTGGTGGISGQIRRWSPTMTVADSMGEEDDFEDLKLDLSWHPPEHSIRKKLQTKGWKGKEGREVPSWVQGRSTVEKRSETS
ncbi:hypothetical protein BDZ91DRAFT_293192 [Kalaharituber pfeilii]|nr:hypothetical protein BDZ91DRAFT_293192 [Kalaharituber pfeilii]